MSVAIRHVQELTDEDEESEWDGKGKGKGKARVTNRGTELTGKDRCQGCETKNKTCFVDLEAIGKWEEDVAAGKVIGRTPRGVACKECRRLKQGCILPRTQEMRGNKPGKGEKRNREVTSDDEEIEVIAVGPLPKKRRVFDSPDPNPSWAPRAIGFLEGLQQGEVEKMLREQERSRSARERIAYAIECIADRFDQDGSYSPPTTPADSDDDEEAEIDRTELKGLREDAMEEDN